VQSIAINFVWRGVKQLQSFILNDCNLLCYFSLLISSCFVFHPLSLLTLGRIGSFCKKCTNWTFSSKCLACWND